MDPKDNNIVASIIYTLLLLENDPLMTCEKVT